MKLHCQQLSQYLTGLIFLLLIAGGCSHKENTTKTVSANTDSVVTTPPQILLEPSDGDVVWFFAKSKDELGPGGELHIYLDSETHPQARASFAKFTLGVNGVLPVHKHDRTEEICYFLSGEGIAQYFENDSNIEIPVSAGYVWYLPPSIWHALKNNGKEPLCLVFATIPNDKKGLMSFFRTIGVKPGEEAVQLSPEEFGRIAREHDLILKPPEDANKE